MAVDDRERTAADDLDRGAQGASSTAPEPVRGALSSVASKIGARSATAARRSLIRRDGSP
jgi:hypothetical protein